MILFSVFTVFSVIFPVVFPVIFSVILPVIIVSVVSLSVVVHYGTPFD
jgi:hypothetical protein